MSTFPLRISEDLKHMAAAQAEAAGVSFNQFIATTLAARVGAQTEITTTSPSVAPVPCGEGQKKSSATQVSAPHHATTTKSNRPQTGGDGENIFAAARLSRIKYKSKTEGASGMASPTETIDCKTLDEFWSYISPIGKLFDKNDSKFIYRGQGNSDWGLIPKIYRKDIITKYKSRMLSTLSTHPGQVFFEFAMLSQFICHCDSIGLPILGDLMEFRTYFKHDKVMGLHGIDTTTWPEDRVIPLMALAQHHGIPTRLLDWSDNPYVACYFAAASGVFDASCENCDKIAVFGINVNAVVYEKHIKHIKVPGSISNNVSAQNGSFILVNNSGNRDTEFMTDVSLESQLIDSPRSPILKKVTLPRALADKLLARCDKFGFTAATIFPGYDGAAKATLEGIRPATRS